MFLVDEAVTRADAVVVTLANELPTDRVPDAVLNAFRGCSERHGLRLYSHQEELIEVVSGANVILSAPPGR